MIENDLCNLDCRKSKLNNMTVNVPNNVRAVAFGLAEMGFEIYDIDRIHKDSPVWIIAYWKYHWGRKILGFKIVPEEKDYVDPVSKSGDDWIDVEFVSIQPK